LTAITGTTIQSIIFDRLEIYGVSASDTRINVGGTFELRYKIRYDYDDVTFDSSKGSVSGGFTWDATNGWWKKTVTGSSSVTSTNYDENYISITDSTYGLTVKNDVAGVNVVTDRVKVLQYAVSDSRTNVGDNVNIDVTLMYEYDGTVVTDGLVTINGYSAAHQGSGIWRIVQSRSTVTAVTYDTVAVSGNTYGITVVNQNGKFATVIWDRIKITNIWSDDGRIDVGASATLYVTAELEYDGHVVGLGDGLSLEGISCMWDSGNNRWYCVDSKSTVQAQA